jgi:hypothetical protein
MTSVHSKSGSRARCALLLGNMRYDEGSSPALKQWPGRWQSAPGKSLEDVSYFSDRGVLEGNVISTAFNRLSSSNLLREVLKSTEIVIIRLS